MSDRYIVPLETLYERFDAIVRGRAKHGDSSGAHVAILDRLAENRQHAAAAGWTSLALERDGGLGRVRLLGVPPDAAPRSVVPDAASPAISA